MTSAIRIVLFSFSFSAIAVIGQNSWFVQPLSGTITESLFDIESIDVNVSYAVGDNGKMFKTTNGGQNWDPITSGTSFTIYDAEFLTEQLGWVCGNGGMIMKTSNGGNTWSQQSLSSSIEFYEINFLGSLVGVAAGQNTTTLEAVLYFTSDGGGIWTPLTVPSGMENIIDIEFTSTTTGYILSEYEMYYTSNGGLAWTPVPIPSTYAMFCIEMSDATHGWISGADGSVFYTSDGGADWTQQPTPTISALKSITIVDANTAFICGYGGTIISTTNGGADWVANIVPVTSALYSISAVDANNAWACGENGKILRLSTGSDLFLEDYTGVSATCPMTPFFITLNVKNIGLVPITSGTFKVFDGVTQVLSYDWSGNLLPGYYENIIAGEITISSNTILTITFIGDDVTSNNTLLEPVVINSDQAYGTNGPITACAGSPIELTAYGGNSYFWLNASSDSSSQTQTIQATSGQFVVAIYQTACTFYDTVFVSLEVGDCGTSAFSPNGDGQNDFFFIDFLPAGKNTVTILNRWGDELIVIPDYDNVNVHWDGTIPNGSSVPEGTYFYTVHSDVEGAVLKGWVQIVR